MTSSVRYYLNGDKSFGVVVDLRRTSNLKRFEEALQEVHEDIREVSADEYRAADPEGYLRPEPLS